ncbi:MAG: porin [Henriciella sp.]|nr:porin [Henriciella sp.]
MRWIPILLAASGTIVADVQAEPAVEFELEGEATLVVTPVSETDGDGDIDSFLSEWALNATAERVLDNGVRWRVRTALRVQQDHEQRPGFTGGFGDQVTAPIGAFSGLSAAPGRDDSDLRGRLETAYLQVDGGYGEVRIGKDLGVANRFFEGAPSVLSHARLDSPLLTPSNLSAIRTRHDLTGPSLKLSYASPRILGLRAGLSFTPEADADGLDRRPAAGLGLSAPDIENGVELALNGTHRFRESGLRVDMGFGWSSADVSDRAGLAPYSTVETWSAGTRLETGDWTFGGSLLRSDNGLPDGDYSAWSIAVSRPFSGLDWSVNYGESDDENADLGASAWQLGAAREINSSLQIGAGYTFETLETANNDSESHAIVVEITLFTDFLPLTRN